MVFDSFWGQPISSTPSCNNIGKNNEDIHNHANHSAFQIQGESNCSEVMWVWRCVRNPNPCHHHQASLFFLCPDYCADCVFEQSLKLKWWTGKSNVRSLNIRMASCLSIITAISKIITFIYNKEQGNSWLKVQYVVNSFNIKWVNHEIF